jgi:hypothetical protein
MQGVVGRELACIARRIATPVRGESRSPGVPRPEGRCGTYRNGTITRNDVLKTRDNLRDSCAVLDRYPTDMSPKPLTQDGENPAELRRSTA